MKTAAKFLELASQRSSATPVERIADALTGILAAVVEHAETEDREEALADAHDKADAALGRVLALADLLAAGGQHTAANRIRAAVDGEEAPR